MAADPTDLGLPGRHPEPTALAQIAQRRASATASSSSTASRRSPPAILILAANTAYNGFPLLASMLAKDRYLPRQFAQPWRPPRLQQRHRPPGAARQSPSSSPSMQTSAAHHPALHHRRLRLLHPVPGRHGPALEQELAKPPSTGGDGDAYTARGPSTRVGAVADRRRAGDRPASPSSPTGPGSSPSPCRCSSSLMKGIRRHYDHVAADSPTVRRGPLPSRDPRHRPGLAAARTHAAGPRASPGPPTPTRSTPLTVALDREETEPCGRVGHARSIPVELVVIDSPYREMTTPGLDYIAPAASRKPPRRGLRLHPRVRRRPLVGTTAPQPERPAPQGTPAVHRRA